MARLNDLMSEKACKDIEQLWSEHSDTLNEYFDAAVEATRSGAKARFKDERRAALIGIAVGGVCGIIAKNVSSWYMRKSFKKNLYKDL